MFSISRLIGQVLTLLVIVFLAYFLINIFNKKKFQ